MATYGEYKIISDRSAADLQNTIAKNSVKSIDNYMKVQERAQKESRMFDIRQRKTEKEIQENKALFAANGKAIANGINDSFVEEYNDYLDDYNEYTNILEDPNSNRKSRKEAMKILGDLDKDIAGAKANQELYIGGTAAMQEKLGNSAALGSNYGFVNLNMGEGKINKDGGVAQDIANQLIGNSGKGDNFKRNSDGSIEASGTYLNADNKEISYTTTLSAEEAAEFLNNPTYDYIKPLEKAVNSIGNTFINKNNALVDGFEEFESPATAIEGQPAAPPKPKEQIIVSRTVKGEKGEFFERRETRTPVDQGKINDEIKGLAQVQYVNFMANEDNLAKLQALETIGLGQDELDLLLDPNAGKDEFQKIFEKRMVKRIGEGIINTNPKANRGLFKDENNKWYFVEQVSKTEITKDAEGTMKDLGVPPNGN